MEKEFFESIMLICFGISWPISVYKSIKSKSTKGKSVVFLFAILIGYVAGITGKFIGMYETYQDGNFKFAYPIIFYFVNFIVVSIDTIIYFINRSNEKKQLNK